MFIPWIENPPDTSHTTAANAITDIWILDPSLAEAIAQMPWVVDGVGDSESAALEAVGRIASSDIDVARTTANSPWFADGITEDERGSLLILANLASDQHDLAKITVMLPWFVDGVTLYERDAIVLLRAISQSDPKLARLATDLSWLADGIDLNELSALDSLSGAVLKHLELVQVIAERPWFIDGIEINELRVISRMIWIAETDLEIATTIVTLPWLDDGVSDYEENIIFTFGQHIVDTDLELSRTIVGFLWFADGVTEDEQGALYTLLHIATTDAELANMVAGLPWFTDGVTEEERLTIESLHRIASTDAELANMVPNLPWFTDGVIEDEWRVLNALNRIAGIDTDLASELAAFVNDTTRDLDIHAIEALGDIASQGPDALGRLTSQSWYTDGLSDEEAALVVILGRLVWESPSLYEDLIPTHFIQTKTILLPLARETNIYVIQNAPFPTYEDIPRVVEESAHTIEDFVGIPFPTTDIILLIAGPNHGLGYKHHRTYMVVTRWGDGDVPSIPHETAHYYSYGGPGWFVEGGADFLETYVHDRTGVQSLADSRLDLSRVACLGKFDNIRHYMYLTGQVQSRCRYSLGENVLISVFDTIGEDAMSAAVRELYLQSLDSGLPPTEEGIYRAFLKHAPADKKEVFRDVYQRLHGGAFAFDKVPFDDDHADEAGLATHIVVGESVGGVLDYMFDFDYFTFQAEEWQKYRITVNHESLGVSSVTLYDPDGLTRGRWKSRIREASGPQIQWVAPSSEEYYFAVQNFGDKAGPYTVTITAVASIEDDHGDTTATATSISLGQVVHGTFDDNFDYDYFQFQASEGKSYRIEIRGGITGGVTARTHEYFRHRLYTTDGVPNDGGEYKYEYRYWRDSVSGEHMVYAELELTPPSSGTFYLAIDAAYGITSTYTVKITEVEGGSDD